MAKTCIVRKIIVLIYLLFFTGIIRTFGYDQPEFELIHPPSRENDLKDMLFFEDQNHDLNLTFTIKNTRKPDELYYVCRSKKRWSSSIPVPFHNWNEKSILCSEKLASGIPLMLMSGDTTNYDELFNLPEFLNEDQTAIDNFFLEGMNDDDIYNIILNNKKFFYSFQINGKWMEPEEIPYTNNSVNPQLAIGEKENALILFYKDMDKNYKTADSELYVSLYRDNYWGLPFQVSGSKDNYIMNARVEYSNGDYVILWTSDNDGDVTTADDMNVTCLVLDNQARIKVSSKLLEFNIGDMSVPVLGKSHDECFIVFAGKNNIDESDTLKSIYLSRYTNQTFTEAVHTGLGCSEFSSPQLFDVGNYLFLAYIDTGKLRIAVRNNNTDTWYSCQSLFHFQHLDIDFSQYDYFIDQNALFHLALIGMVPENSNDEDIQLNNETDQEGIYYTNYNLLPDLTVHFTGTEPRSKKIGNDFILSFTIKNSGYLSSGEYSITIIQNGKKIKEIPAQPLGPNETRIVTEIMHMEKPAMDYLIEVVSDTQEVSVNNNRTKFSVQVLPDYSVTSVEIEENDIKVTIVSPKDIAAPPVPVDLYCQVGDELNKIQTIRYNPTSIEPLIVNWPGLSGITGEFKIIAEVNADRKIMEDDYLNNKSSYSFKPLPDFLISNAEAYEEKIILTLENRGYSICDCTDVECFLVSNPDLIEQAGTQNNEDFYHYQTVNFQDTQTARVEIDIKEKLNPAIEKLYAVINPHQLINEKNQNNNFYPVFVMDKILGSPEDHYMLKIIEAKRIDRTVRIQVKNTGNKPVVSTQVCLYNSLDELIGKKIIPVIKVEEAETVYFKQVPKDSYMVKVIYRGTGNRQNEITYMMPYSFLIEAEALMLFGYIIEENESASNNQLVRNDFWGSAIYDFDEKAGLYDIYITYYDENDGFSFFSVSSGWRLLDIWCANERTPSHLACEETRVTRVIRNVRVRKNEKLVISGRRDFGERARIDCIEFIDSSGDYTIPNDDKTFLIEAEDMIKRNYSIQDVQDASNQKIVITDKRGMGSLECQPLLEPGFYEIQINYFDIDNGKSEYFLYCNKKFLAKWRADKKTGSHSFCEDARTTYVVDGVYIPGQARITLIGFPGHDERANVDCLIFKPSFDTKKGGKK
ncbi:MAG: hypothetical protein JXB88_00520 [Spirochaetales bacterium]|nr:hypothetical protein [Spirochaetales bacterium]